MKQYDFETSNYKNKNEAKVFVDSLNELMDKYIKTLAIGDAELKKISANIEKKNASISKLETSILDLNMRLNELSTLKDSTQEEIKVLNAKKSEISYTDSEVQKMELDDINAQITAKKNKITKVDTSIDSTKVKVKANTEDKKNQEKELKDLEKSKKIEEENSYRSESLKNYIEEIKVELNKNVLNIINVPYKKETPSDEGKVVLKEVREEKPKVDVKEEIPYLPENTLETSEEPTIDLEKLFETIRKDAEEITSNKEEIVQEKEELKITEEVLNEPAPKKEEKYDPELEAAFENEGLSLDDFNTAVKKKLVGNKNVVIENLNILKKHNIPLEYVKDQSEILYNITNQDLDDLLSIITTDEDGNGMGFTIDYTYNILSELSKIDVDQLIDVYNREFINVTTKTGIIALLKMTNPKLKDFDKNRRANVDLLKDLGTDRVDEIVEKYPEFVNIDNPLFINILNVFDRDDLIKKLNKDLDVIPKMMEYWKNN